MVNEHIQKHLDLIRLHQSDFQNLPLKFAKIISKKLKKGGKILIIGNGGSAADSQHIAAELVVRLKRKRKAISALPLTVDTSTITAIGNDFDFTKVFSRQIEAHAKKNDVIIFISTSGNSQNMIEAAKVAKNLDIFSIGLLGNRGGNLSKYLNSNFVVKEKVPSLVQEIHIIFYHLLCEKIEDEFFFNLQKLKNKTNL